jgi:uncharacterized protein (DUF433 family)
MSLEIAPGIVVDPKVRSGEPVIGGTRAPVELIVGKLAGGVTPEEIGSEYEITVHDVRAALAYAADMLAEGK